VPMMMMMMMIYQDFSFIALMKEKRKNSRFNVGLILVTTT
jgi:hypothetical protein